VYPIIEKRFILEVIKYKRIPLGKTERDFLQYIALSDQSAYDICSFLKRKGEPISYKNVRKTLISLLSKGLIEETGEKLPHGAKAYRLNSRGLFQLLLQVMTIPSVLKKEYQSSVLLQNILYQFFEVETIEKFTTLPRVYVIGHYLKECCGEILNSVEQFQTSKSKQRESWIQYDLNQVIRHQVQKLIFDIIVASNLKGAMLAVGEDVNTDYKRLRYQVGHDDVIEGLDNKDYLTLFPNMKLRDDKKFSKALNELKKDFDDGYKNFT
jgi:hypothetical protein